MAASEVVCEVRYRLYSDRWFEFEDYARAWIGIIERYGGRHLGYFLPRIAPSADGLSFPGLGTSGDPNTAVAIYTFHDDAAYERYRSGVPRDLEAASVIERFADPPFERYDRLFLRKLPRPDEGRPDDVLP